MVGRQFKCGGCGKILEVPATSEAGVAAGPRRGSPAAADADHTEGDHAGERGGMPVWMQVTLLVFGSVMLIAVFLLCTGIGPLLWLRDAPAPAGGAGVDVKEEAVQPPPVVAPAKKE
jgi:hypothetical protein